MIEDDGLHSRLSERYSDKMMALIIAIYLILVMWLVQIYSS